MEHPNIPYFDDDYDYNYDDYNYDDLGDDDDDFNIHIDCVCGAWRYGKDGKPLRVADCCCGSNEPNFRV